MGAVNRAGDWSAAGRPADASRSRIATGNLTTKAQRHKANKHKSVNIRQAITATGRIHFCNQSNKQPGRLTSGSNKTAGHCRPLLLADCVAKKAKAAKDLRVHGPW